MTTLQIEVPDDIITLPKHNHTLLETMAREALVIRLYADKSISFHQAAQVLGRTRDELVQILARYGVAEWDKRTELEAEISRQTQLLQPKTPLGQKIVETRARIIVSGEQLLDWDGIQQEVAERRGGIEVNET